MRSAGRMLVGSPVPVPSLEDILNETPVFSGRRPRKWGISSGFAVALACLLAVGAAIGLTNFLHKQRKANPSDNRSAAANVQPRAAKMAQALPPRPTPAPAATPMPAPTPPPAAIPSGVAGPGDAGLTPVAQQGGNLAVKNVVGMSGAQVPLYISVPNASPDEYSFLMIRGLPSAVTISAGFRLKDSWAVSLRDLEGLTLGAPANYEGDFNLQVLLIKGKDQPAESRIFTVSIRNPARTLTAAEPAPQESAATPPATVAALPRAEPTAPDSKSPRVTLVTPADESTVRPTATNPAPIRTISPAEEAPLLDKAATYLGNFNVAGARLLYEHLARRGSAKGTYGLAQTYDPIIYASGNIRGVKPDEEKAREWYRKAVDLGSEEAASRLKQMQSK